MVKELIFIQIRNKLVFIKKSPWTPMTQLSPVCRGREFPTNAVSTNAFPSSGTCLIFSNIFVHGYSNGSSLKCLFLKFKFKKGSPLTQFSLVRFSTVIHYLENKVGVVDFARNGNVLKPKGQKCLRALKFYHTAGFCKIYYSHFILR